MENNQLKSGPKDFFVHLLTFGLLYVFAVSFIALWFEYINIKLPDTLYYSYGYGQLRWPLSVIIVVFPIYVLLARMTTRAIASDSSKKYSRVYRWLVYFTLFISAVTLIIDLISLLNNFLGGELTSRFALKALVVFIVAGGIFSYYIWHLRSNVAETGKKRKFLLWGSIAIALISVLLAFVMVGSPQEARARRLDQQRVNDLEGIQWQITSFWQAKQKLPLSLEELKNNISGFVVPKDPLTGDEYQYIITGKTSFQLCANFIFPGNERDTWLHDTGLVCFDRSIDPDFYPKPLPLR